MSDNAENLVDENSENHENEQTVSENNASESDDSVAYGTYKKAMNQLKSNQKNNKELNAKIAELEADKENAQNAQLHEKQEYKKLYENAVDKIRSIEKEKEETEKALVNDHKKRALEKELGGLKHSDYFKFADLSNIVIGDDGLVDQNSVKFEANRYRQVYPEAIISSRKVEINSQAPSNNGIIKPTKGANEMSKEERSNSKRDFLLNK